MHRSGSHYMYAVDAGAAFASMHFYTTVCLQHEEDEDEDQDENEVYTQKVKSVQVELWSYGYESELLIPTLGGLLQMVECPGYAHLWV